MISLYELAKQAEPGDSIRWLSEETDVEDPQARTVERVVLEEGQVTIEANGPQGADTKFWVKEDGSSEAFYDGTPKKSVEKAELPEKGFSTGVWAK